MLVGFDTEYSFGRILDFSNGRTHCDITTVEPVCACLYFKDGREVRVTENWQQLQPYFDDPQYEFIVHGAHAEFNFCKRVGLKFPKKFYDTLPMGILLFHAESFNNRRVYSQASLVEMAARYHLPFITGAEKDEIRNSIMRGTHVENFGMMRVLDYCLGDCRATVQLFPLLHTEMLNLCGENVERNLVNLYQPYALLMADASRKGLRFDRDGWARLKTVEPVYRARQLNVLRAAGYDHDGEGLGERGFRRMLINLGLLDQWPRTETGKVSMQSDDFKNARSLHPAIEAAYKLANFDSFMGQDMGCRVDRDGHLRCGILTLCQHTGRNSTVSPNLMGIPGELRPLLLPDEGCVHVHFDYCQQEPGDAAWLSGDEFLLADFANGDVYINLGIRLGLIKPGMSERERKFIRKTILKSLMLAILYGKSAHSISRDLGIPYSEAVAHLANFQRVYRRLFDWLKAYVATSMGRRWAENIIGFRAAFNVTDPKERSHIGRSCQNFPVQSSAAACFQLTGLYLADFGMDIRLPLHDAYLCNVPNDPRAIAEAKAYIEASTKAAVQQLFPGLKPKHDVEVLHRFAKDGEEDSFERWLRSLEAEE